jgi:hypothetical protein
VYHEIIDQAGYRTQDLSVQIDRASDSILNVDQLLTQLSGDLSSATTSTQKPLNNLMLR